MNININEKNFFPNRIYTKNELIGIDGWRVLKTGKFQSRSYTVYSKEITHKEISWRLLRGIKALAATLFTFRLNFKLSPCAQKLWKQVKSGIETRKIKVQDELPDTNRNTNEIQQQSLAHLSFSKGGIQNGGNSCYISAALQYFNVVYFNSLSQNKEIAKGDESEEMFDLKKQAAQQTFAILEKLNRGVTITRHEVNALRKVLIKRINKDTEIMNEEDPGYHHLIYIGLTQNITI